MTAPALDQAESVLRIPLERLHPSPSNPRKHLGDLTELAASIKQVGVLEPLVARPWRDDFELAFGHRRLAAARLAGATDVPVIVRNYSDDEVLEAQIVENNGRADVHPLDEADGFGELLKRNYTVQRIADRIGRPSTYVAQRLKLRELGKDGRKALDAGKITLAVAMMIARVPEKLQSDALSEVARGWDEPEDGRHSTVEVLSSKQAARALRESYMLKLVDAKFDRADAGLVPKAGACSACPKRTGNQGELFSDVDSPDLCTDPVCFRAKNDAHWKTAAAAAKKAGQTVLSDADAKKLWPYEYSNHLSGGQYERLDGEVMSPTGRQVKVKPLLGKDAPTPVLARNPHTGAIVELVPKALVTKALKARAKAKGGADEADDGNHARSKKTPAEKAKAEREKLKNQAAQVVTTRAAFAAASAIGDMDGVQADALLLPLLIPMLTMNLYGEEEEAFCRRRGLLKPKKSHAGNHGWLAQRLSELATTEPLAWVRGLLTELLVLDQAECGGQPVVERLLKALGVDTKALESQIIAELKAGKDPSKPVAIGTCRECGCTDTTPCTDDDGEACSWTEPDLCSACAGKAKTKPAAKAKPKARKK